MSEARYKNAEALDAHLKSLGGDDDQVGEVEPINDETTVYTLHLGDTVTTCEGGASFTREDGGLWLCHFDITLGPANAKRLVDFLLSLPDEPDDDEVPNV
jgi:hypothetical protein